MAATRRKALLMTVNYKSESSALKLLASLERLKGFSQVDVVVVDNCSGNENLLQLRTRVAHLSNVELLELPTNCGYFAAAKVAYDQYLSKSRTLPDWIIICNHDVVIEDDDFLPILWRQDCLEVGVIAPRIRLTGSSLDQNPFMKRPPNRLRWASLQLIYSNYFFAAAWDRLSRWKRAFKAKQKTGHSTNHAHRQLIYAPHGSFVIFSRKFFEVGGYLDENLFLYGEEISVAEICRTLSLDVIYEPSLSLWHNEHASTGKVISRLSYNWQKRALNYVSARYLGGAQGCVEPGESKPLSHARD